MHVPWQIYTRFNVRNIFVDFTYLILSPATLSLKKKKLPASIVVVVIVVISEKSSNNSIYNKTRGSSCSHRLGKKRRTRKGKDEEEDIQLFICSINLRKREH